MIELEKPQELLKLPEVAAQLKVSVPSVYRYIARGDLSALRLGPNGVLRVPAASLAKFLEQA